MNPLDSSIVFDGGWRLLQGQRFFVDFSSPSGFAPSFIQAIFFQIFGVNWFAYCLHAAVFNGLFALLVYGVLLLAKGPRWLSAGYAALSAVVFYPPMGVPYLEQHAFFFILLAVYVATLAAKMNGGWRFGLLSTLPTIALFAILSKQSPGFFVFPLILIVLICWFPIREWKNLILPLLGGLMPAFILLILMVGDAGLGSPEFWEGFWTLPQTIADQRLEEWTYGPFKTIRTIAWYPFQVLGGFDFIHRYLLYVPFLLLAVEVLIRFIQQRLRNDWPPIRLLILGIGVTVTCSFFMHFTLNQPQNGLPLVFVAIGLGHIFWREWLRGFAGDVRFRPVWLPPLLNGLSILLFVSGMWSTWQFHKQTNEPRFALDFTDQFPFNSELPVDRQWGFLNYQAPYVWGDLKPWEFVEWMNAREGNFLLFGDLSIVYGLTGRPSVSPALWFHEGLTFPAQGTEGFSEFDAKLLAACKSYRLKYLVFEQESRETWMHSKFEDFPQTSAYLHEREFGGLTVGGFLVVKLDP